VKKIIPAVALFIFSASIFTRAQTPDKPAQTPPPAAAAPAKPVDPLAWLVGGVWKADASQLGPGMKRIETRYEWSDNGAYLHFTTHFIFDKGTLKNYDGSFFWEPDSKSLAMWYVDRAGNITKGPVQWSGDRIRINWHGPDFDGNPADLQVDVTRKTNDLYHWAASEKVNGEWKEMAALDYTRDATIKTP